MRHIKTYKLFESATQLTEEQIDFLNHHTIGNWSINSEGKVDVKGDFYCSGQGLTDFKGVKFGQVSGDFNCRNNSLTTLEGAPETVDGDFACSYNSITSLVGAPVSIGSFNCSNNSLTTLVGAPESVGGYFSCDKNSLTSLVGAPETVNGNFRCSDNALTTLEGAPKTVGGYFDGFGNSLTSLVGAPETVSGGFYCYDNSLESLVGAPETVGGVFYCDAFETNTWTLEGQLQILKTGTPEAKTLILTLLSPDVLQQKIDENPEKMAVALKNIWKDLKSDPKYSTIKWPNGLEKEADLLSDLDGIGL